ncbi:hypothetical protein HT594_00050 [Phenacoccus solenopsis nudivirus]|nr:hypothetical protein HT594_00050 [Phenacoccus solenopsis nudivirus]
MQQILHNVTNHVSKISVRPFKKLFEGYATIDDSVALKEYLHLYDAVIESMYQKRHSIDPVDIFRNSNVNAVETLADNQSPRRYLLVYTTLTQTPIFKIREPVRFSDFYATLCMTLARHRSLTESDINSFLLIVNVHCKVIPIPCLSLWHLSINALFGSATADELRKRLRALDYLPSVAKAVQCEILGMDSKTKLRVCHIDRVLQQCRCRILNDEHDHDVVTFHCDHVEQQPRQCNYFEEFLSVEFSDNLPRWREITFNTLRCRLDLISRYVDGYAKCNNDEASRLPFILSGGFLAFALGFITKYSDLDVFTTCESLKDAHCLYRYFVLQCGFTLSRSTAINGYGNSSIRAKVATILVMEKHEDDELIQLIVIVRNIDTIFMYRENERLMNKISESQIDYELRILTLIDVISSFDMAICKYFVIVNQLPELCVYDANKLPSKANNLYFGYSQNRLAKRREKYSSRYRNDRIKEYHRQWDEASDSIMYCCECKKLLLPYAASNEYHYSSCRSVSIDFFVSITPV